MLYLHNVGTMWNKKGPRGPSVKGIPVSRPCRTSPLGLIVLFLLLSQPNPTNGHGEYRGEGGKVTEPDRNGTNYKSKLELCNHVSVTHESATRFLETLRSKNANFGFVHVHAQNRSQIYFSQLKDVLFKSVWIWTLHGEGGAFPFVWYSHDYYSLSFGILDRYTEHGLKLYLTTNSSSPCVLIMGGIDSTKTIANAFNAMMETSYLQSPKFKRSVFCYAVRYKSYGPTMKGITHLLGIVKGYRGYKCCHQREVRLHRNTTFIECPQTIEVLTKWYCVLYALVLLCFFFSPVLMSLLAHRLTVPDHEIEPDSPSHQGYQTLSSDSTQGEGRAAKAQDERWIFLGVDKPITLFKVFCKPFQIFNACPVLASRLQRFMVIFLTPSIICFKLFIYYYNDPSTKRRWIQYQLEYGIPVGFLAIPFGFQQNMKTWEYAFGGPYVMYALYFSLGLLIFLLPRSFCKVITSCLKVDANRIYTLLWIDLQTLEKWGTTSFCHLHGYDFIYNVVTANFYALLNKNFWLFTKSLFVSRFCSLNSNMERALAGNFVMKILYRFGQLLLFVLYVGFCVLELSCALLYYGLPAVFLTITIIRGYNMWLRQCVRGTGLRIVLGAIISVIVIHSLIAFSILFICSGIYVISALGFTYIGLVIYPEYTVGYVIGAGTLAYYIVGIVRKFNDVFSELLDVTVSASMRLEDERSKSVCKVTDAAVVLSPDYAPAIETIKVYGEIEVELTEAQRRQLQICGYLKNRDVLVRWRDNQPGIPYKLFVYVMRRYCPLHVHVFWFLFRLAAFCLIVVSLTSLLANYHISRNLSLPAQVLTAVSLNVLPRVVELCVSKLDIRLAHEHFKRCIETAVGEYWVTRIRSKHRHLEPI